MCKEGKREKKQEKVPGREMNDGHLCSEVESVKKQEKVPGRERWMMGSWKEGRYTDREGERQVERVLLCGITSSTRFGGRMG